MSAGDLSNLVLHLTAAYIPIPEKGQLEKEAQD